MTIAVPPLITGNIVAAQNNHEDTVTDTNNCDNGDNTDDENSNTDSDNNSDNDNDSDTDYESE